MLKRTLGGLAIALAIGLPSVTSRAARSVDHVEYQPMHPDVPPVLLCAAAIYGSGKDMSVKWTDSGGCIERKEFLARATWRTALNADFLSRFDDHVRAAGVETDYVEPLGGGHVRRDKFGLARSYPGKNAPYDVLVDFHIGTHGYAPVRTPSGARMYAPFVQGVLRLIDGETGKPFSQKQLIYGPVYLRRAKALWVQPADATFLPHLDAVIIDGPARVADLRAGAEVLAEAAAAYLLGLVETPGLEPAASPGSKVP